MRGPTRRSWESINIDERREKLNYEVGMLPEALTDQCESRPCVSMAAGGKSQSSPESGNVVTVSRLA